MHNKYITAYLNLIFQSRKDNYYQQLLRVKNNYNQLLYTQEQAKELSEILFSYNNPKKEKMALWFLIKGTVRLPEDQYKIDQAFNLVEKQHLNFQEYTTPQEIINKADLASKRLINNLSYNIDNQSVFSNKQILKNGVVIYNVQDSKEGQIAVRKVIDANWGYEANPWCLTARPKDYIKNNKEKIQNAIQQQRNQLLYGDQILKDAWQLWTKGYFAYPKRIAFQNGKLLAFCANDKKEIKWWNRNDKESSNIPRLQNEDDPCWNNLQYNACSIAQDLNTPIEILNKLANDNDSSVRQAVSKNQNIPLEILIYLANDKDNRIRQNIAKNSNTPLKFLSKFSNDIDWNIRQAVAKNQNTPPEILSKLANDKIRWVKIQVAQNSNTSIETLQKLADSKYISIRQQVARNPNSSFKTLIKLAKDKDPDIRMAVAENLATPGKILEYLANDENFYVRSEVAANENTSIEILYNLTKDKNNYVKTTALFKYINRKNSI